MLYSWKQRTVSARVISGTQRGSRKYASITATTQIAPLGGGGGGIKNPSWEANSYSGGEVGGGGRHSVAAENSFVYSEQQATGIYFSTDKSTPTSHPIF
jgi:hypothetical protein